MATPQSMKRFVGQRKPFTLPQIHTIAQHLLEQPELRDATLFMVGIKTMLRCSNLLRLTVRNVTDNRGIIMCRFSLIQIKTKKPITVQIDTATSLILQRWIAKTGKQPDDYLFTGLTSNRRDKPISRSHFRTLVKSWATAIGLDPTLYSTHSLRRSRATLLYQELLDPELVRILLGQSNLGATSAYLGLALNQALDTAEARPIFEPLMPLLQKPYK